MHRVIFLERLAKFFHLLGLLIDAESPSGSTYISSSKKLLQQQVSERLPTLFRIQYTPSGLVSAIAPQPNCSPTNRSRPNRASASKLETRHWRLWKLATRFPAGKLESVAVTYISISICRFFRWWWISLAADADEQLLRPPLHPMPWKTVHQVRLEDSRHDIPPTFNRQRPLKWNCHALMWSNSYTRGLSTSSLL